MLTFDEHCALREAGKGMHLAWLLAHKGHWLPGFFEELVWC